jgi:hypothetical protein
LDLNCIADFYGKWIESNPFDIGYTTRKGLNILRNPENRQAKKAIKEANQKN